MLVHGEPRVLQELTDPREIRPVINMLTQSPACLNVAEFVQYSVEYLVQLLHVALQVCLQCYDGTGFRHAAALTQRARPIIEVVHAQVRNDQVECAVIERHLRCYTLVHADVLGSSTRKLLFQACQAGRPGIDPMQAWAFSPSRSASSMKREPNAAPDV